MTYYTSNFLLVLPRQSDLHSFRNNTQRAELSVGTFEAVYMVMEKRFVIKRLGIGITHISRVRIL